MFGYSQLFNKISHPQPVDDTLGQSTVTQTQAIPGPGPSLQDVEDEVLRVLSENLLKLLSNQSVQQTSPLTLTVSFLLF